MFVETPTRPLSPKDIEIIVRHLQALCSRYPVSLCYLYGSQVRGTAHALSDVDVGFLLHDDVGFLLHDMDRKTCQTMWVDLYDAVSRFCPDHEVDLVLLNLVGPLLRNKVIREGRLVFKKEERIRVDFECRTLASYFDFHYFSDIYDRTLFEDIKGGKGFGRSRNRCHAVESVARFRASPD